MTMHKTLSVIALILTLSSCSNATKQAVGLTTSGPDEYQVRRQDPLYVPPHYELKEPAAAPKERKK